MKTSILYLIGCLMVSAFLPVDGFCQSPAGGYEVGDLVEDFSLTHVNGQQVSLADYPDARGFIIVFTCNTCPYARAYESRMIELDQKYAPQGFPVIAINPNDPDQSPGDSMEGMIDRASRLGYPFPYLQDASQEVAHTFGATKTPHVFVLSRQDEGACRVEYIGAIDDSPREPDDVTVWYVAAVVEALLAGQSPPYTEKRAIGCTIKWAGN